MVKEEEIEQAQKPEDTLPAEKPKKFNTKVIIIGLPIFIAQLIIVYFVTANLLLSKITKASTGTVSKDSTVVSPAAGGKKEIGKYIFSIEDVIVNPADTEGKRLLLTSIGFDLPEEPLLQEFKSKEILLKDIIISTLSGKTLMQLSDTSFKDSIKTEIASRVKTILPGSKLNTVYISKYIIQ